MVGHPTKRWYIFKDILQALVYKYVLKFRLEQKKVTANMIFLQFGKVLPSVPVGVVSIPKGEIKVINIDLHHKEEKGLVPVSTPRGELMWVHPDIIQSQQ